MKYMNICLILACQFLYLACNRAEELNILSAIHKQAASSDASQSEWSGYRSALHSSQLESNNAEPLPDGNQPELSSNAPSSDVSQSELSSSEPSSDASQSELSSSEPSSDASQSELSSSEPSSDASQSELSSNEPSSDANQSELSSKEPSSDASQSELSPGMLSENRSASNSSQSQLATPAPARSKRRFNCSHRPALSANHSLDRILPTVTLINSSDFSELRDALTPTVGPVDSNSTASVGNATSKNESSLAFNQSQCAVLLYYLTYCPYSVALAPHFNALPRAFPGLHFFAVEADRVSPFYANYTTGMAPHVRLFRDREFIGVNISLRDLASLIAELANLTGHTPVPNVTIADGDFVGPVPTVLVEPFDYYLLLSVLYFVVFLLPWLATKSQRTRLLLARFGARMARLIGAFNHPHAD